MGDDEAGSSPHQFPHGFLDLDLGTGVHVGGGLIQDQHGGIGEEGPGDGDQLSLSPGDVDAVIGEDGVIPIRQALDVGINPGIPGRGLHILHGGILPAVADVFGDGSVEEPGILQYHREGFSKFLPVQLQGGQGIDADLSGYRIVKAHQQIDDGGLSGSRGSHDGDDLSRRGVYGHILQDGLFRGVAEGDVIDLHFSLYLAERQGIRGVRRLRILIQNRKDPLGCGEGGLELVEDVGKLIDGSRKLP